MGKRDRENDGLTKVESIKWVEVLMGIETPNHFGEHEIKRALKKTGRQFNNNGPFHRVVRQFIEALGDTVTTKMINGKCSYSIPDLDRAMKQLGYVKKERTFDVYSLPQRALGEIPKMPKVEILAERIKPFCTKNGSILQNVIDLVSIFVKYERKELDGSLIKRELVNLGNNTNSVSSRMGTIKQIFSLLGYSFEIKKVYHTGTWCLYSDDPLAIFLRLQEIYKFLVGRSPKSREQFISSEKLEEKVEKPAATVRVPRTKKEVDALFKETSTMPAQRNLTRVEDTEAKWKKWLILSACKERRSQRVNLDNILNWIKTKRCVVIEKEQAETYCRELAFDLKGYFQMVPNNGVILNEGKKDLLERYNPKKLKESFFIKLRLTPEELTNNFMALEFSVDEAFDKGYIYEVTANYSFASERELVKLLRILNITGKIYSSCDLLERAKQLLHKEESESRTHETTLKSLEEF